MLAELLGSLVSDLAFFLKPIFAIIAIAVSLAGILLAYKQYKKALFLENPIANSQKFYGFYKENRDQFGSVKEAAETYYDMVQLSAKYEYLYGRQMRARENFYKSKNAYHYLKSLEKKGYKSFSYDDDYDDDYDDLTYEQASRRTA